MTDEAITDLKQFISTTVSQQAVGLRADLRTAVRADLRAGMQEIIPAIVTEVRIEVRNEVRSEVRSQLQIELKKVHDKIDNLSLAIGDTLDAINANTDSEFQGHGQRLVMLERMHGLRASRY